MKKVFTFLPGHRLEKDKKDPPEEKGRFTAKRREQVRRAQRTHRERKEQYVRSLETEVLRLRSSEMNLQVQTEHLHNHISILQAILETNGLEYPVAPYDRETLGPPDAYSAASSAALEGSPAARQQILKTSSTPDDIPVGSVALQPTIGNGLGQWGNTTERLCDKDLNEVGIEFVLALENPCLPHLEPLPNEGNGHALTATMSLTRLPAPHLHADGQGHGTANSQNSPRNCPNQGSAQAIRNSSVIFNNLLALSHEIIFDEEISPIQAWSCIIQQPWAPQLEIRKIKELGELLLQYITCHGFGAVLSRDAFNDSINSFASSVQSQF
ncbi:hypothetical protein N7468_010611 [Penicillium chermesinum]|uniref:BZIP domain-containing protein n=1 Tax=Penicillium chermesinum TaxID=63820 RepID=A0A9W9N7Y6_9EURO|nr:uncharacterized protein N7468_010611 [Penicillium chermesinum]KAJ5214932.1 hypothetical protein N7468_010611 [Penicillium chermesinum]